MTSDDSSRTTLLLYQIESPDWTQVDDRHRQRIVEPVVQGGWRWANGNRRGFLHCKEQGGVLYGYFAAEGSLDVEQYDENQQPIRQEQKSFERLLFLLFLNEGMLLVQSIRVYNFRDISGPLIRDSLLEELSTVFRDAGLAFENLRLVRYRKALSKEEMQQLFFAHDITAVEIDGLFGSRVPSDVRLFNPDFDADAFLKAVIDSDLGMSDKSTWEGEHLQRAKIVKGLVAAGNPKFVRGYDEHGELREWDRSSPEDIPIVLNTEATYFPDEDLARLLDFIRLKYGLFRDRLTDIRRRRETGVSDLPLFDDSVHT